MRDDRDPVVRKLHRLWEKAGSPSHRRLAQTLAVKYGVETTNTTISNYMAGKCPPPSRMDVDLMIALVDELGGDITKVAPEVARRAERELEELLARERFLAPHVLQVKSLLLSPVELAAHRDLSGQMELCFDPPPDLTVIDLPALEREEQFARAM